MRSLLSRLWASRARKTQPIRRAPLSICRLEDRVVPAASLYVTAPAVGAPGSVVREFTNSLEVTRTLLVPAGTDGPARDLAVAGGKVHVFNGTSSPQLSSYDVSTNGWTGSTIAGWDTTGNVNSGGVALGGGYAYATDSATAAGPAGGVIRFDLATGAAVRFADGTSPIDVAVGGPGWIYTLDEARIVRVYRPDTLGQFGQFELPESIVITPGTAPVVQDYRAIAVNGQGQIFTADWNRTLARFGQSPFGPQLQVQAATVAGGANPAANPMGNLIDLDLDPSSGRLAVGSTNGTVAQMSAFSFSNAFYFGAASGPAFVAYSDPLVAVGINRVEVSEAAPVAQFTVSLTRASATPVSLSWESYGNNGVAGADFIAGSETIQFNPGETAKTIDVTILNDTVPEGVEFFYVSLNNLVGATYETITGVGTIMDDDGLTVSVGDASATEGASPLNFTLTLSTATPEAVTFYASTASGTAISGFDFTGLSSHTVTFAAGETSKTVSVALLADANVEPNETFKLEVRGSAGGPVVTSATGTILNDDDPTVSVTAAAAAEGAPGTTTQMTFTVSLSNPSSQPVTVFLTTFGGSATAGSDYTPLANQAVTFAPGETSKSVSVAVIGDNIDEPAETFGLEVRGVSGALLAATTGTITDDDPTPTVSVAAASVVEGDSGVSEVVFVLTLSNPSSSALAVNYATSDGSGTAGIDYTVASGTATFSAGQTQTTVKVFVAGETNLEADETFKLTLSSPGGAVLGAAEATGTIVNDDYAPVADAGPDLSGNEGSAVTFSAAASSDADGDSLTFAWNFGDGSTGQGVSPSHAYAENGVYTVTLTADDGHGGVSTDTLVVAVSNVAPTAGVSGPATGVRGQARTFTFTASDPSPADRAGTFTYRINWGDGSTQTVTGPASGVTATHTFVASGNFAVSVTATDDDGGIGPAATGGISITAAAIQNGDLVVGGTNAGESITLTPANTAGAVRVQVGAADVGTFTPSGQIVVYALGGNDVVDFQTAKFGKTTARVSRPFVLYGGDGNDVLDGRDATGAGVLLGGAGADTLYGGAGRSILIGGLGADVLRGGSGDDVVIGGTTEHDESLVALAAVRAEWTRTDADYATRRTHLSGQSTGLNGTYLLDPIRVDNDFAVDDLYGSNGQDWFFFSTGDRLNDRKNNETVTNV